MTAGHPDQSGLRGGSPLPLAGLTGTPDLLDLAPWVALGLVEEDERHAFDVALSAAREPVREGVERAMAQAVDIRHLLPADEPSPELRGRVLDRVRAEIELAQRAGLAEAPAADEPLTFRPPPAPHRVSRWWRAGALGLLAACVALGAVFVQLATDVERSVNERHMAGLQDEIGTRFVVDTLFSESTQRFVFEAVDPAAGDAQVALWYNPDWQRGRLYFRNLPEQDEGYVVAEVDAGGAIVRELASFVPSGGLESQGVRVAIDDPTSPPRIALFSLGSGGAVRMLMTMSPRSLS